MVAEELRWLCEDCRKRGRCPSPWAHTLDNEDLNAAYGVCKTVVRRFGFVTTGRVCPFGSAATVVEAHRGDSRTLMALKVVRPVRGPASRELRDSVGITERRVLEELLRGHDARKVLFVQLLLPGETPDFTDNECPFLALELLAPEDGWMHARALGTRKCIPIWEVVPIAIQWCDAMRYLLEQGWDYRPLAVIPGEVKLEHLYWNVETHQVKVIDMNRCQPIADRSPEHVNALSAALFTTSCAAIFETLYPLHDADPTADSPALRAILRNSRNGGTTLDEGLNDLRTLERGGAGFQGDFWQVLRTIYGAAARDDRDGKATARKLAGGAYDQKRNPEETAELNRLTRAFSLL